MRTPTSTATASSTEKLPPRPTRLDPYKPLIDEMLRADLDAPRKQRHTVKRIFERLLDEHGADEISHQMSVATSLTGVRRSGSRPGEV